MHSNSITKLINLKDVVKKIVHNDFSVNIYLVTLSQEHIYPCCGAKTSITHDYREQVIKDLPM